MPKIQINVQKKARLNQKQREIVEQIVTSVRSGIVLGFGLLFVAEIVSGILGNWISILWWIFTIVFAFAFVGLSYFRMDKRAFKWSKIVVLVGFLLLFPLFSANLIFTYQSAAQSLTATKETDYFRNVLGRSYNYTELYQWEQSTLNWNNSSSMIFYSNPIQIREYGQARCGGYAILYAELCISQGYEARIVVSVFGDHVWNEVKIEGNWTRVDVSPTGAPMIENIGYPLFYEEKWGTPPILALAFENSSIVDVTSNYRSDKWSLLSSLTAVFVLIGAFFTVCIALIWKLLFRPLREAFSARRKLVNPNKGLMQFSLDNWLRETRFEVENPLIVHGNEFIPSKTNGGFVTLNDHGNVPDNIFRSSTVVLGLNKQNQPEKAHAEWGIQMSEDKRLNLNKAILTIRSSRIQTGLHLHGAYNTYPLNPNVVARIFLNGKDIDELHLVAYQMPFGTDYGFGRDIAYPIERIIDENDKKKENWNLSLEVGEGVLWDIDEISLQVTTQRRRYKAGFWTGITIGGVSGGFFGWGIGRILDWLLSPK